MISPEHGFSISIIRFASTDSLNPTGDVHFTVKSSKSLNIEIYESNR